jgi:uncharacterized membrane protein
MKAASQIPVSKSLSTHTVVLAAVLVFGLLLRILYLGQQGLFLDEAWSWAAAHHSLQDLVRLTLSDPHPPLYYLVLKVALLALPSTETGLRMLSVLCAAAAQLCIVIFVRQEWGARAAAYAGLFVALSSFDVYYAQETRMYSLLGLLWIVSYISQTKMLQGSASASLIWIAAAVAMAWTHLYGALVVIIQLVFVLVYPIIVTWRQSHWPLISARRMVAIIPVAVGIAPTLLLAWYYRTTGAGGAWIPTPQALTALFNLWSVGLSAARTYFLDGDHLVWLPLAAIPTEAWAMVGVLTSGLFFLLGLQQAWRADKTKQIAAVLAILLLTLPIAVVFGLAISMQQRWWAFKPFLGAAYLYYLWAGVGLSRIRWRWLQYSVVFAACVVATFSLVPYFTIWQKSDSAVMLRSIPQVDQHNIVVIEPAYLSVLARYYLGATVPLWQVSQHDEETWIRQISDMVDPAASAANACESEEASFRSAVDRVWIYGPRPRIDGALRLLPTCFPAAALWIVENNQWSAFDP